MTRQPNLLIRLVVTTGLKARHLIFVVILAAASVLALSALRLVATSRRSSAWRLLNVDRERKRKLTTRSSSLPSLQPLPQDSLKLDPVVSDHTWLLSVNRPLETRQWNQPPLLLDVVDLPS